MSLREFVPEMVNCKLVDDVTKVARENLLQQLLNVVSFPEWQDSENNHMYVHVCVVYNMYMYVHVLRYTIMRMEGRTFTCLYVVYS